MTVYTSFTDNLLSIYSDNVDDYPYSDSTPIVFANDDRDDMLYYHVEKFSLAAAATRTITLPAYASTENYNFIVKTDGEVQLTLAGKAQDGSTTIHSYSNIYGTAKWSGILALTTKNITSIVVTGVGALSNVEIMTSIIVPSTDSRIVTNA